MYVTSIKRIQATSKENCRKFIPKKEGESPLRSALYHGLFCNKIRQLMYVPYYAKFIKSRSLLKFSNPVTEIAENVLWKNNHASVLEHETQNK